VTNSRDETFGEIIESDLTALYAAEVPNLHFSPDLTVDAASRWPRVLRGRWRPALAGVGVVVAVAVALAATALRGGETQSVSAEEVFERASASAQNGAPIDGTLSYHMVSTAGKLGTDAEFTTETWYGGEGRYRSENSSPDGSIFGQVVNGDDVWMHQTFDGVTRAAHGPAATLGKGFAGESLAGQQNLPEVLAQYSGSCQLAEQTGEDTFAGRSVYVIVLTTDLAQCESDQDGIKARVLEGSSLNLWVDKETFLTLQTEHREPDGRASFRQAATEFTVSPNMPESVFTYEAPEGTTVVEVADLGEAKQAIVPLSSKPPDGSEACSPPTKDAGAPIAKEC
jgi:outer membrane lipoprotein-sorting protein